MFHHLVTIGQEAPRYTKSNVIVDFRVNAQWIELKILRVFDIVAGGLRLPMFFGKVVGPVCNYRPVLITRKPAASVILG